MLRALLLVAAIGITSVAGTAAAAHSPSLRVTLTAENHHPRASHSPSVHWSYCVKVRTASGASVPSVIRVQVVSGRTVWKIARISLRRGYDHWCQALGGEAGIFNALPPGKRLVFQAVVTAQGATVTKSWPIVVRRG